MHKLIVKVVKSLIEVLCYWPLIIVRLFLSRALLTPKFAKSLTNLGLHPSILISPHILFSCKCINNRTLKWYSCLFLYISLFLIKLSVRLRCWNSIFSRSILKRVGISDAFLSDFYLIFYLRRYKAISNIKSDYLLHSERVAVYTVVTNGYDRPSPPAYVSANCDYILFTDDDKLIAPGWSVRLLENPSHMDKHRLSRYPKIMPHLFLNDYNYSIYVDANFSIVGDVIELLYPMKNNQMALFKHYLRKCIYEEASVCLQNKRDSKEVILSQMRNYQERGFPHNYGLSLNSFIIRQHMDKEVIRLMSEWWEQVNTFSKRDQLSLFYVFWVNDYHNYKLIDAELRNNQYLILRKHAAYATCFHNYHGI